MEVFPGSSVVNGEDCQWRGHGFNPWIPGRSHMPWSNWACLPQLLSLCSRVQEPQPLSPHAVVPEAYVPRACAPQQGRRPQWEAHMPQLESSPCSLQLEKSPRSSEDPAQPKIHKISFTNIYVGTVLYFLFSFTIHRSLLWKIKLII